MNLVNSIWRKVSIKHIAAVVLLIAHLATLIPLFAVSVYDVPSADDYSVAVQNRQMNELSSNIWERIVMILKNMIYSWQTQQGTFSAYLLTGPLNPTGLHDGLYYLCPVVLLIMFHLSLLFMLWQMLHSCMKVPISYVLIIYSVVATIMVQLIPSVVEGFYWYSGATLYVGFFCIGMFGIGLLVKLMYSEKRTALLSLAVAVLGLIVGGSNYPSAVGFTYVICLAIGYSIMYRSRKVLRLALPLVLTVAGLLLNVMAPGNFRRLGLEGVAYHGELLATIRISFLLGKQFFRSWFTLPVALAMVGLEPVIVFALRKTRKQFHLPFAWIVLTFIGYALLFAPCAYSYGWIGPQRYMNIAFFGFILMLFSWEIYITGWGIQKVKQYCQEDGAVLKQMDKALVHIVKKNAIYIAVLFVMSLGLITSYDFYVNAEGTNQRQTYASESAYKDLKNWQAQAYYEQFNERMEVLKDGAVTDAVFEPYWAKPNTLYFDDISDDKDDWRNQCMTSYYGKNSVIIVQQE